MPSEINLTNIIDENWCLAYISRYSVAIMTKILRAAPEGVISTYNLDLSEFFKFFQVLLLNLC